MDTSQTSQDHTPDAASVASLLEALERITRAELPDGAAREALAEAIRCGEVIGVYTPTSHTRHTIELAYLPRDIDPRTTAKQWATWWNAGKSPTTEHLAEQRAIQAQARAAWAEREAEQGGQTR